MHDDLTAFFSIPFFLFFPLILLSLRRLDNATFFLVAEVCLITDAPWYTGSLSQVS